MEKSAKEFYNDEATIEIEINKHLTDGLERFDTFLSWVDSNYPEIYTQIIHELENRLERGNILIFPPQFTSSRFQKHANLFKKAFDIRSTSLFTHMITQVIEYMEKIVKVPIKDIENNMGQYVENDCTTTALWLYSKFKIVFKSSKTVKSDWGILKLDELLDLINGTVPDRNRIANHRIDR